MCVIGTTAVLEDLKSFYLKHYKKVFAEYEVDLEFKTILTYYSGTCSILVELTSVPSTSAKISVYLMLNCQGNDLIQSSDEVYHRMMNDDILMKYNSLLKVIKLLCQKEIKRPIAIKCMDFNDPVINMKLNHEMIHLEINLSKIENLANEDWDMLNIFACFHEHLRCLNRKLD